MSDQPSHTELDPHREQADGNGQTTPLKRRRITRACDRCHRGGIKCAASSNPHICGPCAAFGTPCTYDRPVKRRGPPAKSGDSSVSQDLNTIYRLHEHHNNASVTATPPLRHYDSVKGEPSSLPSDEEWVYRDFATAEMIEGLVDAFRRISYPIQPYFHWPSFRQQVRSGLYRTNRPFSATVMAVCATTSSRLRDGAAAQLPQAPDSAFQLAAVRLSEEFYEASVRTIPKDLAKATDFNYKRAKAVLTILGIQYGLNRTLCSHLGDYLTICGIDGFHNESRWPPGLNAIEIQERRRLFWQMYQLDVYAAITWNGIVRHRESQSTVLYAAEVDDDEITEAGIQPRPHRQQPWLRGWNFVVDLYRILEHAVESLRARKLLSPDDPSEPVSSLFERKTGPSGSEVMNVVGKLYDQLSPDFKGAKAMTGNLDEDVYGFQAANIILTLQTVKMVMAGTENSSVSQRCMIAGELLDALASVPTAYIHACGAPMMHHLAGIGHLLGSVIQSPLSQWTYLQVRNVLLAMVDLLASLESVLSSAEGGSARLKAHVARIDQYMTNAALEKQQSQVYHSALPKEAWASEPLRSTYNQAAPHPVTETPTSQAPPAITTTASSESSNLAVPQSQPHHQTQLNWAPHEDISPNTQFQLPDDLFADWPFDIGQGDAFDFLGLNASGTANANVNGLGASSGVNTNANGVGMTAGLGQAGVLGVGGGMHDEETLQGVLGGLFGLAGDGGTMMEESGTTG